MAAVKNCTRKNPSVALPKIPIAICATTDLCSLATTPSMWVASHEIPRNIVTAIVPMIARVAAAFLAWGRLNAGTPLEIASTPVSAVAPWENAFRIANRPTAAAVVAAPGIRSELTPTAGQPWRHRASPITTRSRIETTNP